jgi:hypothetical protein
MTADHGEAALNRSNNRPDRLALGAGHAQVVTVTLDDGGEDPAGEFPIERAGAGLRPVRLESVACVPWDRPPGRFGS